MSLLQIIYFSEESPAFRRVQLGELVSEASRKNQCRDITGALYYGDGLFLQVLEGEEDRLIQLYSKILDDPRHSRARLLRIRPIDERSFKDWGMGLVKGTRDFSQLGLSEAEAVWRDSECEDIIQWFRHELVRDAA